jgi:hypothetical protein
MKSKDAVASEELRFRTAVRSQKKELKAEAEDS